MAIEAVFRGGCNHAYSESVHQYDKNLKLQLTGVELPESYEVHFSNNKERGYSVAFEGPDGLIPIPDAFFMSGDYVYAFIYSTDEDAENKTKYVVTIPVIPRPVPVLAPKDPPPASSIKYEVNNDDENLTFLNVENNVGEGE